MTLKGKRATKYPKDIEKVCLCCGSVQVVRFHTQRESVINYYCSAECKAAHWGKHKETREKLQQNGMSKAQANKPVKAGNRPSEAEYIQAKRIARDTEYWQAYRASRGLPRDQQQASHI